MTVAYAVDGVASPAGTLFVRNDSMTRFVSVPMVSKRGELQAEARPPDSRHEARVLRRPARSGHGSCGHRSRGRAQGPDFAFVLESPVLVRLGVHRFGRTHARASSSLARAETRSAGGCSRLVRRGRRSARRRSWSLATGRSGSRTESTVGCSSGGPGTRKHRPDGAASAVSGRERCRARPGGGVLHPSRASTAESTDGSRSRLAERPGLAERARRHRVRSDRRSGDQHGAPDRA